MSKPKLVQIITRFILGGAQLVCLSIAEGMRARGWDVEIWTGPPVGREGALLYDAWVKKIPIRIIPEMRREILPSRDFRSFLHIRELLARHKPQVVHTHSSKAGVLGRIAACCEGVPVIVHTVHGLPFGYGKPIGDWFYPIFERYASGHCDSIYCVSKNLVSRLDKFGIAEPCKASYLPWGFSFEQFEGCDGRFIRKNLGVTDSERVVMVPARLAKDKGHEDAIEAFKQISADECACSMLFVGDGELRDLLEQRVASEGLSERILFAGKVNITDIPAFYAASDVVLLPSYREGLPVVLAESFMAGKPCIAYDTDGVGELVITDSTGILVEKGNISALARSLSRLLADRELCDKFAAEGRKLVTAEFSQEVLAARLDEQYHHIARQKGVEIADSRAVEGEED